VPSSWMYARSQHQTPATATIMARGTLLQAAGHRLPYHDASVRHTSTVQTNKLSWASSWPKHTTTLTATDSSSQAKVAEPNCKALTSSAGLLFTAIRVWGAIFSNTREPHIGFFQYVARAAAAWISHDYTLACFIKGWCCCIYPTPPQD
jgi:hypothetical protein